MKGLFYTFLKQPSALFTLFRTFCRGRRSGCSRSSCCIGFCRGRCCGCSLGFGNGCFTHYDFIPYFLIYCNLIIFFDFIFIFLCKSIILCFCYGIFNCFVIACRAVVIFHLNDKIAIGCLNNALSYSIILKL
jgi:hypothetical protein